ncbi:MAG TPA: glycosyltransferase family 39 protein [Candidatus Acidoferrum sp.]|nr:glycosyltransferase family 39 protein [Candidatus Acidoferrum sp.]
MRRPGLILFILFLLSVPLLNPWVRGDGVGYYAFARALLIQHNLDFTADYQHANPSFRDIRIDAVGQPKAMFRTSTGYLDNHFTIGPAILWAPFLLVAHAGVLIARGLGFSVLADGFSAPYRFAMAFGTGLYGFLGLLIAFRIARKYVDETWALLATLGVWAATSLPVYMYLNPSWSHAHSAFVVALFFWYWHDTREKRSLLQWVILGAIAGLMLDVYYPNATILAILAVEAIGSYGAAFRARSPGRPGVSQLLLAHGLFLAAALVFLLPTFITRSILYGSPFKSGYIPLGFWNWTSPYFLQTLFSSNHGLIAWTPLILFSLVGLVLFWRQVPHVGGPILLAVVAFYYFIASYPDWAGISSFGNRFFVSLTVFFVLGLAIFLQQVASYFRRRATALAAASVLLACFTLWNFGLMFQWGTHMIPARGPVSWSEIFHNQFFVVPRELSSGVRGYLFHRKALMRTIEQRDLEQLNQAPHREP